MKLKTFFFFYFSNDISESRVAEQQPTTGSDTIGLVLELLGVHLIEIMEPTSQLINVHSFSYEIIWIVTSRA